MRAMRIHELTGIDALRLEEVPPPTPGPGELHVAIHVAGVNFADTLVVKGQYQHKAELPFTPGMEAAGKVLSVGDGVTGFTPGDRVLAPMRIGAYAEEALIDARHAVHMPDGMDYAAGAAFPIAYGTSHLALTHRTKLQAGQVLQGTDDGEPIFRVGAKPGPGTRERLLRKAGEKRQHKRTKAVDPAEGHIFLKPDILDIAPHDQAAV